MEFIDGYPYPGPAHVFLTVFGLLLLVVIVFTLRAETGFLIHYRKHRLQVVLSLISIFVMALLTLTCLFHWSLPPLATLMTVTTSVLVLLVLAPLILILRTRTFAGLAKDRREERRRLIKEVLDMIDEKKREKIRKGKIARGEEINETK